MNTDVTEVSIYPFAHDDYGDHVNANEHDLDPEGWNVHSLDGDTESDEKDFDDFDSAMEYAEELADRYGVRIDHRY